ncbi:MAG TPA: hypothetical protein GX731_02325 [Clostridiales bacterium]|nr:hypothetical protein [Clostridiales bacterium]
MNKQIRMIDNEVRKGKNLDVNIPKMFNYIADYYYNYSSVNLTMNYYSFYEFYLDEGNRWSKESKDILDSVNKLINNNIVKDKNRDREQAIKEIDGIRNLVMRHMKQLSAYADIFDLYEYALNRIEYRFKDDNDLQIDDEDFAKEILRYIFDTEENYFINAKILDVIGQLPVRMTKQKFLEHLRASLYNYKGAKQSSLNTYLYMLRTTAMIYSVEGMESDYKKLWDVKESFTDIKFNEMAESEYKLARKTLDEVIEFLTLETRIYYDLMEVINHVYAMVLCSSYIGMEENLLKVPKGAINTLLSEINAMFGLKKSKEVPPDVEAYLGELEGIQEDMYYELTVANDAIEEVAYNYGELLKSLMIEPTLITLLRAKKLQSDSIFIDLDDELNDKTLDDNMIIAEADKLEEDLIKLFSESDRMIVRGIMANVLGTMPVFFDTHTEVMEYIRYSLVRCTDPYEKVACLEVIREIMSK